MKIRSSLWYGTSHLSRWNGSNLGIPHIDYDVDPWSDFGSGNGDNTTYPSRRQDILPKATGEFNFWEDNSKPINDFQKIDKVKKKWNLYIRF